MKKIKLCLFILLLPFSISFSQILNGYGIKIGYVSSRQDYSFKVVDDIIEWKSGISFSVFADLFDFNSFSILPEIKYIQKGWEGEFVKTGEAGPNQIIDKFVKHYYHNYLSIPVAFQYRIKFGFGEPFIKIAPRYDFHLTSYDDDNSNQSYYKDFKNVFGGTISVGFFPKLQLDFNPFIEVSYHLDFTNTYSIPRNNIKNRAIEINLGIEFQD